MAYKTLNIYTAGVSERVLKLLEERKMSRSELAERLDLDRSTLSTALNNTNNWGLQPIIKMTEIFNVSLDYLILGKGASPREAELRKELNELLKENKELKDKLKAFDKVQKLMQVK